MDNRRTTSYERHSPIQFQDLWFLEKLAQFDRETSNTHQRSTTGSGSNAPDK
ncbi:catalase [Pectobacterium carotovorum subsp. carotovorum]|nr:catalase [Pectobacterium carotovorum subsp. carotovorum]